MEISGFNNSFYGPSFPSMYPSPSSDTDVCDISETDDCQDCDSTCGTDECDQDCYEPVDCFEAQGDDSDWGASSEDTFEPSWEQTDCAADSPYRWMMN